MADLFSRLSGNPSGAGTAASTQPASGSLFTNVGNTAAPSGGGLFSSTAKPATSSGGGLFGSAATTSTAAPSLFANTSKSTTGGSSLFPAAAPATGTSLFGAPPASAPQRPNSLFASMAAPASQSQTNAATSVFGDQILPSQQEQSSVTRNLNPDAPPAQPSYFQALLDKGNKRMADENNGLPQLQYGLQDIARKVRNVGQGGPSAGVRGSARSSYVLAASGVNVGQSLRDIEELMDTTPIAAPALPDYGQFTDIKDFLGSYHRQNFQKMIDSRLQQATDDFNRMIDDQLHMQPLDWEKYRQRIDVHFGLAKPSDDSDVANPGRASEMGSFGRSRRSRLAGSQFGLASANRSVIGAPGANGMRQSTFSDVQEKLPTDGLRPAPEDRTQRLKQDKYAGKVKDLTVARIQEKVYPIMTRFAEVEAEPNNEDTSMLVHAYKALVAITGEDASKDNITDPGVVRERHFACDYLDDNYRSKGSLAIRQRIINGSRSFLEKLFYSQLKAMVAKNPREANIGGVPTSVAEVKGYVRVRATRKELGPDIELLQDIQGDYCWAVMFYLLRSGLFEEAAQYLGENAAAFKQIDRKFAIYLRAYVNSPEHRLTPELQTAITNEYATRQRLAPEDSIDPYRMMCYKIIGRCDLAHRNLDGITNDMMDWMWLQFALAREYQRTEELAHEAFGLEDLRLSIKEIGERYFGPNSDIANAPTTFFFMQVLAGMFEKAIADLFPHNYVSATHFAIALDFYGLLRVSGDLTNDDLLSHTTRQQPQIAFGSLIGLYTRDFRTANATAAIDYLTLICLNADLTGEIGKKQKDWCYQAIRELVLETREFAQLLGDIRSDGQRIKGAVEQRLKLIKLDNEREFMRHITLIAARTAVDQSRITDAALLFHLAEDYDQVIQVVNEALSVYLTTELGEEPARLTPLKPRTQQPLQVQDERLSSLSLTAIDDPVDLALSMRTLYTSNDVYVTKIKPDNLEITNRLITLANARKLLEQGKWAECIDVRTNHCSATSSHTNKPSQQITASNLIPTNASGILSDIRSRAQSFNEMDAVLARTISHVMLWTVVACNNNVDKLRRAEFETGHQKIAIERTVQTAKDVVVFAGLIRYRLPGRVWETLAQAGQDLGAY
jgi:nuclear pore complex protein Nup93